MTKTVLKQVDNEIKQPRVQVTQLHTELEDLEDYLDVLKVRRSALGKKTLTQSEMEKRYVSK
ncbi:MAG: hypothetical protein ABIQ35_06510 [Verrucomicrobiota bacterium]